MVRERVIVSGLISSRISACAFAIIEEIHSHQKISQNETDKKKPHIQQINTYLT